MRTTKDSAHSATTTPMKRHTAPAPRAPKAPKKAEDRCWTCVKPTGPSKKSKCAICSCNGWRRFCDACEEAQLTACDSCQEFLCSVCMVPKGKLTFAEAEGSGSWNDPCEDPKHEGPNDRLCDECQRRCPGCDAHMCRHCFMSEMGCRTCVLKAHEQLVEYDDAVAAEKKQRRARKT